MNRTNATGPAALALPKKVGAVLFDMDGVLVDSTVAMGAAINHARDRLGLPHADASGVKDHIGEPMEDLALWACDGDATRTTKFVELYRERYDQCCEEKTLAMPAIGVALTTLARAVPLAVATNKPQVYAERILEALGLARHFRAICGRSLELDRATKADVIRAAVGELGQPQGIVMVGDRHYDVAGAQVHGLPTVGVLWGSGSEDELRSAGAVAVVASPAELLKQLAI